MEPREEGRFADHDGHCDDETLVSLALADGDVTAQASDHVARCPDCAADLAAIRRVLDAEVQEADLIPPPTQVWERIEAELAGELPTAATQSPRRPRMVAWGLAASLVLGAALGAGAMGLALRGGDGPAGAVIASASLDPLPGWNTTGSAEVLETDGRRELTVTLPSDAVGGYQEVWLISTDLTRLVSLGILQGESGTFALPPEIDLTDFAIVDVSDEPADGDPSHSGVSIVRGELTA